MRPREEWPKAAQRKAPVTMKERQLKQQQSTREKALRDNPWAMALAQPNRKDVFSQANIPRDFCIQFRAVSHPMTGKQWAAPRMLLDADDDRQVQQASTSSVLSYLTANRRVIEAVFDSKNKHLPSSLKSIDIIREDMADYIAAQMRQSAIKLYTACQNSTPPSLLPPDQATTTPPPTCLLSCVNPTSLTAPLPIFNLTHLLACDDIHLAHPTIACRPCPQTRRLAWALYKIYTYED